MYNRKSSKIKILFFGLGSIGLKHAKILKEKFDVDLYAYRTGKGQEKNTLKIQTFNTFKQAFDIKPDVAFITNPIFLHVPTALQCVKQNIDLFIEKPLSHSLENLNELEAEIKKRKLFTYIAYNMRFHPVIINLKELIQQNGKPFYFRATCNSYLPNWRPRQDYTKSYSAKKSQGGGVTLDLSHEFDYITWLFGEITNVHGYIDKISDLNIDSEDIVEAQLTCNSVKGSLHLDCFSLENERKIQLYYNDKYVEGDLNKCFIKTKNLNGKEKIIRYQFKRNDMYEKQLIYFFEQYKNRNYKIMNNFSEALKTFKKIMKFKSKYC